MRAETRCPWRRMMTGESGAGALEFALISPALLFMIIGVIQVSLALYKGSTVQWVSERAVRVAMIDASVDAAALTQIIEADLAEGSSAGRHENESVLVLYRRVLAVEGPLTEALLPVMVHGRPRTAQVAGSDAPPRAASALAWHDAGGPA